MCLRCKVPLLKTTLNLTFICCLFFSVQWWDKLISSPAPPLSPAMTDLKRFMCQDTNYSGWLMNRSSHGLNIFSRHWHRSWFILADGHLHYFKHQGSIPLHGCRLISRTSNHGDHEPLGYVLEIHPGRFLLKSLATIPEPCRTSQILHATLNAKIPLGDCQFACNLPRVMWPLRS